MSLMTGRLIQHHQWMELPMPEEVIKQVQNLGRQAQEVIGIIFKNGKDVIKDDNADDATYDDDSSSSNSRNSINSSNDNLTLLSSSSDSSSNEDLNNPMQHFPHPLPTTRLPPDPPIPEPPVPTTIHPPSYDCCATASTSQRCS